VKTAGDSGVDQYPTLGAIRVAIARVYSFTIWPRRLGEHCKLLQQGLGQSRSHKWWS